MQSWQCPIDEIEKEQILLGHGSGGELTHQLVERIFRKYFKDPLLDEAHDSVGLELNLGTDYISVMTTDGFVVHPLFFAGGNIGKLSIVGTINDLAMSGAEPLYLSCSFIIEEGLKISILDNIVEAMAQEALNNKIRIVCGDTKVVERGRGDGIFITTTGIGKVLRSEKLSPSLIQEGDAIIVSGEIGKHGMAVMIERENLKFESQIVTDCKALWPLVQMLKSQKFQLHCLRDLSRGGMSTALVELAETSGFQFTIEEDQIPVSSSVRSACELLGLDPSYVANEGTCVIIVPENEAQRLIHFGQTQCGFTQMKKIGQVQKKVNANEKAKLFLKTLYGQERRLFRLSGDQLPRIC